MRIARKQAEVAEAFQLARSEAKSSFGDDRTLIEKFIENPRHIEIQVLGDKHGNVVHLFERECSIQRRNQKVIEEAPSPFIDDVIRAAMGAQAVALAKAVGYESAGTVEFIVDKNRNFYFLEMNTRLQVEHPVTEMITGVDLVEQMIRVAAGEALSFNQSDLGIRGWAIESRIYAEDPSRDFVPSVGRLVRYRPPAEGTDEDITIRNDTGVYEGSEVFLHYDPMIAKLITYAPTRSTAISAMSQALDTFYIDGIRQNIAFLSAVMHHSRWQDGNISTAFIAEEYPAGFLPRKPDEKMRRTLACVAAFIDHLSNQRRSQISGQMNGAFHFSKTRVALLGDASLRLRVVSTRSFGGVKETEAIGERVVMEFLAENEEISDTTVVKSNWWPGQFIWQGTIDDHALSVQIRPISNGVELTHAGIVVPIHVYTEREAEFVALMPRKHAADASKTLRCPMPGLVRAIHVAEGQHVKVGEPLCTIEAMKMENILRADRDALVKTLKVKPGDSLAVEAVIMEFG
jgi:propionyl-CoA carboxylase alpha chain